MLVIPAMVTSEMVIEVCMQGCNDLVKAEEDVSLAAKCAAVKEIVRLISMMPESCLRNVELIPFNVVKAIKKSSPATHFLFVRTLARCIDISQVEDVDLGEEDTELSRVFLLALVKELNRFESNEKIFVDALSLMGDGYVMSYNVGTAASLHLTKALVDAQQQTIEAATQLEVIRSGASLSEFLSRWPKYGNLHYKNMKTCISHPSELEVEAVRESTAVLLNSLLKFNDIENVSIFPSSFKKLLPTMSKQSSKGFVDILAESVSFKEGGYDNSFDGGLNYLFWYSICAFFHSFEPVCHIAQNAADLSSKYIFEFDFTPSLMNKMVGYEKSSKSLHQQFRAVNAGIGHELFFKTWPSTTVHIYRQMRDSAKIWSSQELRGQLSLSAKEEFAIYDYFCAILDDNRSRYAQEQDGMDLMLDAWYKTKERFDEIMPFGCFVNAQR